MRHELLLICGRSLGQGVSANQGKLTGAYQEITATLELHPDDAAAAGVADGDAATLEGPGGRIGVTCQVVKPDQLPPGVAFMAYGPPTSQLMGAETHGTGMPDAKNLRVWLSPAGEEQADG